MGESYLFQKAESLLARISSSAFQQAASSSSLFDIGVSHSLHNFKDALISFKDTLFFSEVDPTSIRIYYGVHERRKKIQQVFIDAENLLDHIHSHSQWESSLPRNQVGRFFFFSSSSSSSSPTLATQINDITRRLQHCADEKTKADARYAYHPMEFSYIYASHSDVNEEESDVVIGREFDKEIIIDKLLLMQDDQIPLSVFPIVGMEGLGKTTLAKIVLGDKRIRESFLLRMWVSFSYLIDIREVIIQMINSTFDTSTSPPITRDQLTMLQLQQRLKNILSGKKFLLVLDNVWKMSPLTWDELRNLIQIGANGSKVLLTTRSHSIASMMGTIPSHNLQRLSPKDSLSLFEKLATKAKAYKYSELIEIGREIVNRCEGVPSVIKAMGNMLFPQHWMVEWKSMRDSEFRDLPEDYGILPALRLSYCYMPFYLKRCFELFSLYPNDFVFHSSEIVSLWAALDLLPSPNIDENLIDVSYQCLQKIIPRIFFKEFVNFGASYYFQIHDLLLDLARGMAKYGCLMVNSNLQDIPQNVQHLSFVMNNLFGKSFTLMGTDVRTILFPNDGVGATSEHFLNACLSRCRYLCILDLSDSTYEVLPSSIGKLRYLRFLSLERNEKIKRVPDSICKLQSLQVLNLIGCIELKTLPKGLRNLVSLRQLGITTKESALLENDITNLNSLESLRIESCGKLESFFVGIKLPSLKTLEVINCGNLKYLPLDIDHFPQLETLLVDNCDCLELIKRHGDQSSNLQLKAIHLHSLPQLVSLPRWLQKSTNTLQSLLILDCKNFEVLPEWLSTFNVLGSFGIANCPKLMSLPNDIHCLVALGYLRIEDCPEKTRFRGRRVGGSLVKRESFNKKECFAFCAE
ncbi:hypothetical protein RIF29_27957 [Crotalaria pallida]|uniref:NB-ARC domain-containing protein n=1 Tax=Crotalaria pallida TaxID=3830 RepID=A0AAN9I641_CROPI